MGQDGHDRGAKVIATAFADIECDGAAPGRAPYHGPRYRRNQNFEARARRKAQRITAGGISASVFWLLLCLTYIHTTLGWSFGGQMLAHELGAMVAGMTAPLAFLWLGLAYFRRGYDVRETIRKRCAGNSKC